MSPRQSRQALGAKSVNALAILGSECLKLGLARSFTADITPTWAALCSLAGVIGVRRLAWGLWLPQW